MVATTVLFNLSGCSDNNPTPKPPLLDPIAVKIAADKSTIKANGKDLVTFAVTADGKNITADAQLFLKGTTDALADMTFSTEKDSTYTFYATYDGEKSNEITIKATDVVLLLSIDKEMIKADNKDIATFTITADGEDVTSLATISWIENPDSTIGNAAFSTKQPGSYTFYATYNEKKTNEVSLEAAEVLLLLSVDKSSIKANNSEKATFTITLDGEDVTTASEIYLADDTPLGSASFYTDNAATYTFYAIHNGDRTTNEIQIEATYVELKFLMQYCIMQIASTACATCPKMTQEIKSATAWNKNIFQIISLHPYGKICNSELSGALASTAVQFAQLAGVTQPPVGIVDFYNPFNLFPTTTSIYINDALNSSTAKRKREAKTGIAIQSSVHDKVIDFKVKVKTNETNEYRIFAFVVEDHIIHRQRSYSGSDLIWLNDYEHNNVATYMLEGDPLDGIALGEIQQGEESTTTFSINTTTFDTKRDVNLDNCRIVAYTLRIIDGGYYIDNITNCPVNGSVDYKYTNE